MSTLYAQIDDSEVSKPNFNSPASQVSLDQNYQQPETLSYTLPQSDVNTPSLPKKREIKAEIKRSKHFEIGCELSLDLI